MRRISYTRIAWNEPGSPFEIAVPGGFWDGLSRRNQREAAVHLVLISDGSSAAPNFWLQACDLDGNWQDVPDADLAGATNGFAIGAAGTVHQFRYTGQRMNLRPTMRA